MRPIYEDRRSLTNEQALIQSVYHRELASGWEMRKLPRSHELDYAIVHAGTGELVAFVEAKCRTGEAGRYTTFMVAASKVVAAERWHDLTHRPVWLLVSWEQGPDRVRAIRLDSLRAEGQYDRGVRWGMGGRTDRGDPADVEVCAYIPMDRFQTVQVEGEEAA